MQVWHLKRVRRVLPRYALAAASVAGALGIRALLDPVLETYAPYLPFALAVMVVGRFGGRGPALAATLGSVLTSWYFLLEPRFSWQLNRAEAMSLVLFAIVGTGISVLAGQLHQALDVSRRSEVQLRRFIEFAPAAIAMFDREMRYLAVSHRYLQDYGIDSDPDGRSHYDVFPEVPARWREIHRRVLAGNAEGAEEDFFERANGQVTWLRWEMRPWYQRDGTVGGAVLATEDISSQKAAQAALQQSEQRFRTLFENAADGIYIVNPEGYYIEVNEQGLDLSGYPRQDFLGRHVSDFIVPADHARLTVELEKLRRGQPSVAEWLFLRKDGSTFPGEVSAQLLPDGNFLGILRDLTERRHLEDQFRQAQKLEGIGRLAGGVAHDFNNLLTVICGYARMAQEELPAGNNLAEHLGEIQKAGDRAAALTQQLLAFSRNQVFETKAVAVDEVVRDFEKMLRRIIGEDIQLRLVLGADMASVRAGAGRLEQIILNLAVNARDAMPLGGRLTIETGWFNADDGFAQSHVGIVPGRYVALTVSDTGTGMTAAVKSHAFEPFFTTKDSGKGTGLGLSTVYGIVKQSGGLIWIESEPGRGASFHMLFPPAAMIHDPELPGPNRLALSGTETILLVEDEPDVRKYLRQALERHGYTVIEAADGKDGLELARRHTGSVHLLLTDIVMPEMSGTELAASFGGNGIPVLCMSGYSDTTLGSDESCRTFLQKPFTIESLLKRVRDLLAAGGDGRS